MLLREGGPGRQPTARVLPGAGPAEKGFYVGYARLRLLLSFRHQWHLNVQMDDLLKRVPRTDIQSSRLLLHDHLTLEEGHPALRDQVVFVLA